MVVASFRYWASADRLMAPKELAHDGHGAQSSALATVTHSSSLAQVC